jgi:hypothetical protein
MGKKKLSGRSGLFLVYFFVFAFVAIAALFVIYHLFLGQALADRGVSENLMPVVVNARTIDLDRFNELFNCKSKSKVVDLPHSLAGMFPYLLKNTQNTCNRASDFIGAERFLDAFLYGEAGISKPATAKSKETPFLTHHPGLLRLRKLVAGDICFDRSNSFFWWMFPLPIATPSRGFSYTIFWGDFEELSVAAERRNLDFVQLFGEGIQLFLKLNGLKSDGNETVHRFSEQDHVFVKAFMSLQCMKFYTKDQRLNSHEETLTAFMKERIIRYPTDYQCVQ